MARTTLRLSFVARLKTIARSFGRLLVDDPNHFSRVLAHELAALVREAATVIECKIQDGLPIPDDLLRDVHELLERTVSPVRRARSSVCPVESELKRLASLLKDNGLYRPVWLKEIYESLQNEDYCD